MKSSKSSKAKRSLPVAAAVAPAPQLRLWPYALGLLVAAFAVFQVYSPAMYGPFLLDDTSQLYMLPGFSDAPLKAWIRGVRPMLMFSYWLNFQQAGNENTFGYHLVNVLLHWFNGILIYFAVRKALSWVRVVKWHLEVLALFAAGLFLFHPIQTESVSYVASRSETLSVFFVLAAYVAFVYRKGVDVGLGTALGVLILFGAAALTKEHTAVLPVLFLLTDYYWNPGFSFDGIRRNWKLYVPIMIGAGFSLAFVWRVLTTSLSAGFGLKDLTWYQYFFTQCRAVWEYLRMFLLPYGQNADYDFPFSRSITDHGTIFGLLALVAVSLVAWIYRRRFPLASYGWFTFLILIAPTSSLVPLRDPLAERRLYLPFIGLLFITVDLLRRWKAGKTTLAAVLGVVLLAEGALAYQRNELWSNAIELWKDTVAKSPNKLRPRFQLAYVYYQAQRCTEAVEVYAQAAQLEKPGSDLLIDWALAYDCADRPDEAIDKLKQAAAITKTAHVYSQIGMEYGKQGKYPEALDALASAEQVNPNFAITYLYRGNVYEAQGNKTRAAEEYRRALALDRRLQPARDALARVGQ